MFQYSIIFKLIDKYNLNNLFSVNNLINTNTKKMLNLFKKDKFNNTNNTSFLLKLLVILSKV